MKKNRRKIKVFIASPYTQGNKMSNVMTHLSLADVLITSGFTVFAPLLFHYLNDFLPHPEETWKEIDLEWLSCCDVVFRMTGASKSADAEVQKANRLGTPVFYKIEDLIKWADTELEQRYGSTAKS
jgi:hypothetical protein